MQTVGVLIGAAGALVLSGPGAAQGIALFGDARLGLGYNIDNDGGALFDENGQPPDRARAVSRARFGVYMEGESDSGVFFGAEIRADNAREDEGGKLGQVEGSVFVSGGWGALSFGDTDGADQQWVGDVPGNLSLTGLTDISDTKFISNGGSFGDDAGDSFAENPFARPTIRYDLEFERGGISVSTNRDLTDLGIGAGIAGEFGEDGSWSIGLGYYRFASFVAGEPSFMDSSIDAVREPRARQIFPAGEQWSMGLAGEYASFTVGITFTNVMSDSHDVGHMEVNDLLVGAAVALDPLSLGAFFGKVVDARGTADIAELEGDDGYGFTWQYDLGGGGTINGGIANTYATETLGAGAGSATVADFGISLAF